MLHELLFALIGKPGSLIKLGNTGLQLDQTVTMLSESQKQLINGMCVAGTHFRAIQAFIQDTVSSWTQPTRAVTTNLQDYDESVSNRSAYRKSLCYGLNEVMDQYKGLILDIEQDYLEKRLFTYANLQADLNKYLVLLPDLTSLVAKVEQQDLRGGQLLDVLYGKLQASNMWVREAYQILFRQCYKVLFNQLYGWMIYGKLLDAYHQFFVHRIEAAGLHDLEKDWDSAFTLQLAMLPNSLLSKQTAQKVLFVGKSVRILRQILRQQSLLPPEKLVLSVKQLEQYEGVRVEAVVEQVRYQVAQQLMDLIMKRQNLLGELEKLKAYYLMARGEFFHIFLEQAQSTLAMPHNKKSQQLLNTLCLQNTMIRLQEQPDPRLSFQLKQNGFTFKNFGSLSNLSVLGNVNLKPNNFLRFQPVKSFGGSLWHNVKQHLQAGFTVRFSFRFKRLQGVSLNATQMTADKESNPITTICYVLQNSNQISSWRKDAPVSLKDLKEYLCVKVCLIESTKRSDSKSILSLNYYDSKKLKAQECIAEVVLNKKTSFVEQDFHQLKISYSNQTLRIIVDDFQHADNSINVNFKMGKYLTLDIGRAFMGFLQHSTNSSYAVDIITWQMLGNNLYNSSDYWGDLTLSYDVRQPLKLILSNQLLEKYKQIFKLLFPIRQAQIDLDRLWLRLSRRLKRCTRREERFTVRKLSIFRNQLSILVNSLWSFLQSDVVETQWCKLVENLEKTDDFEKLRHYLDLYIKSISNMCFLSTPRILKSLFELVKYCKDYVALCCRFDSEQLIQASMKTFLELEHNYKEAFRMFTGQIKAASKGTGGANHLYQLLLRLDYNGYYEAKSGNINYD